MRVLVMDVRHVSSALKYPELDVIIYVAVIHVRWVVGEERRRSLHLRSHRVRKTVARPLTPAGRLVEGCSRVARRLKWRVRRKLLRVGRLVYKHRRIPNRPRAQEELFKLAVRTSAHRTYADAVGVNLSANTAGAVVDRERILTRNQHLRYRRR